MRIAIEELNAADICALLPHAGGVCQIEGVSECDAEWIVCITEAQRRADNPLRPNGRLAVHAGIEMAGQAMALHMALQTEDEAPPRQGMITRLKDVSWTVERLDIFDGALTITANCQAMAGQMARYAFALEHDRKRLLEGSASVLLAGND